MAALDTGAVEKKWVRPRIARSYHDACPSGSPCDGLDRGLGRSQNVAAVRHPTSTSLAVPASLVLALALAACKATPPEPTPEPVRNSPEQSQGGTKTPGKQVAGDGQQTTPIKPAAPQKRKVNAKPTATVTPSSDDPVKGKWSLDDATKGLPAGKQILATIETDLGSLECKLFDDKAPITVANFVGLARGTRPWKTPEGPWEKKPAYDGTPFHRIIKGFMIQGGDAKKNGSGEAGYVIPDEVWEDGSHDRAGLLCMANRGPNTNSAQFFITDAAAYHLDNGYTIFGECGPEELVHKIANVEVAGEHPKSVPVIKKVTITRK
jgi:peptidyl-prolyl cis-trans isomerase A (cyclophilin A)